jgi:hypothetical protein
MVSAIDAVCDVAQRIIGKLKDGAAAGGPPLLGSAVGNRPAAYPPTPAMKRLPTASPGRKAPSLRPAMRRRFRSAENFSANTRPKKPRVKRRVSSTLNRKARHRCCTASRSHKGKASSFPGRPRPTRLLSPRGLTRTEARGAANAVTRPHTSWQAHVRLNRRRRRRDLGIAELMLLPLHILLDRLPRSQIRLQTRRCGFPMATRRSL